MNAVVILPLMENIPIKNFLMIHVFVVKVIMTLKTTYKFAPNAILVVKIVLNLITVLGKLIILSSSHHIKIFINFFNSNSINY